MILSTTLFSWIIFIYRSRTLPEEFYYGDNNISRSDPILDLITKFSLKFARLKDSVQRSFESTERAIPPFFISVVWKEFCICVILLMERGLARLEKSSCAS